MRRLILPVILLFSSVQAFANLDDLEAISRDKTLRGRLGKVLVDSLELTYQTSAKRVYSLRSKHCHGDVIVYDEKVTKHVFCPAVVGAKCPPSETIIIKTVNSSQIACIAPPLPHVCTLEHLPVCANGKTFGNRCEAERAGFKDVRKGACPQPQNPGLGKQKK